MGTKKSVHLYQDINIGARLHLELGSYLPLYDNLALGLHWIGLLCFTLPLLCDCRFDDDDPNFVEEKTYFKDEINPLSRKDITKMTVKEILAGHWANLSQNVSRTVSGKVLSDGGIGQDDGNRPRSEVSFKVKWLMVLAALGLGSFVTIQLIETGVIELSSPEADYIQQVVVHELNRQKQSESGDDENKREP